ncbi:MAG: ATP-binding protein [Methanomassiliicoccaceae archaeon]|jgi:predicted AAA+ superfamily ATPase|nr:ATP-binding protein [Methanomassiliicoccaceae archaeon]
MISNNMVLREDYLKRLRGGKDKVHTAKVITGMRRSGKSTLMQQFMDELESSGVSREKIFFFGLESKEYEDVNDFRDLNAAISSKIPVKGRVYVFLDEVQRVKDWERTVNSLMTDYDADIYITGSNAYLLSSELATYMSGRYIEIKILPLSFKEYLELHPADEKKNLDARFGEYVAYGALPMIDPDAADKEFINGQIEGVYNTVLVKDVQRRLKPKNIADLEAVSKFLYSNIGNVTNTSNISKYSGIAHATVKSYIGALEEAYLFYKVHRFDIKGKNILSSSEKYYASDTGVRNTALNGGTVSDTGRLLENVVFLELLRRGYNVTAGSYRDMEIDFAAQRLDRTEYFQVTQSLIRSETAEREIRSLDHANDNYAKTILSLDRIKTDPGKGIRHTNVIDWLLGVG